VASIASAPRTAPSSPAITISITVTRRRIDQDPGPAPASEMEAHDFEAAEAVVIRRRPGAADDPEHLLPGAVLPLRVHGEHDHRPREQHRRGLHAGEVEQLALPDHVLRGHAATGAFAVAPGVLHVGLQQQPEEVVAGSHRALSLRDDPSQDPLDLSRDPLHPPVDPCRQHSTRTHGMHCHLSNRFAVVIDEQNVLQRRTHM
jgi:hypothetical protein